MTRDELEAVCWRELGAIGALHMRHGGAINREWLAAGIDAVMAAAVEFAHTEAIERVLAANVERAHGPVTPTEALLQEKRRAVLARRGE
jgi:hypothetical protein